MIYICDGYELKILYRSENESSAFDLPSAIRLVVLYKIYIILYGFTLYVDCHEIFRYTRVAVSIDRSVEDQYEAETRYKYNMYYTRRSALALLRIAYAFDFFYSVLRVYHNFIVDGGTLCFMYV